MYTFLFYYGLADVVGIILVLLTSFNTYVRIFVTDPLKQLDFSNFIMGLLVIVLFSPFSIIPSLVNLYKKIRGIKPEEFGSRKTDNN